MTNEEAKQLKKGDKILIEAEVEFVYIDGDIKFSCKHTDCKGGIITRAYAVNPKNVTLMPEKPKYDPCRLFRKGDKVRVVEWNGHRYLYYDHSTELTTGCICEVNEDEKSEQEEGWVSVDYQGQIRYVPPCFLELVTPVEELAPYSVQTGGYNRWSVKKGDLLHSQYPFGEHCVFNMDEAKAAAEAVCDWLNDEYGKEQSND